MLNLADEPDSFGENRRISFYCCTITACIMASGVFYLRLVAFIVLLFVHSASDDGYPAKYQGNLNNLYRLVVLHFILWANIMLIDRRLPAPLIAVWVFCVIEFCRNNL